MSTRMICIVAALLLLIVDTATADDLTRIIQTDLATLGYDAGDANGEMTPTTIVAISKFQAEHDLEVTGEATPQLAGIIKAEISKRDGTTRVRPDGAVAAAPAPDPAALQAAQQACLQEKIAQAQASQQKKKGFGSLMKAVTNTAVRFGGGSDFARQAAETSRDVYDVNATAADWERAAEDLGLTTDDIEACRNPQ